MIGSDVLLARLWRYKFLALALCLIGAVGGYMASLTVTPQYEAEALLLVGQGPTDKDTGVSPLRQAEIVNSKVRIGSSLEVVEGAVQSFGVSRLGFGLSNSQEKEASAAKLTQSDEGSLAQKREMHKFMNSLRSMYTVRAEPNTDIIRITFRHPDSIIAQGFAGELVKSFLDRHVEIYAKPGEADFIVKQTQTFERELDRASTALAAFEQRSRIYSDEEQRNLIQKRLSDTAATLATTRGSIAEKEAQIQSVGNQLLRLRPIIGSPAVASLIGETFNDDQTGGRREQRDAKTPSLGSDPPLLLVRIYQNSVEGLLKSKGELSGLQALMREQAAEVKTLNSLLAENSKLGPEYARLKREAAIAASNVETYARKGAEAQVNAAFDAAKFSSLKVVQAARSSVYPVFPSKRIFVILGALIGLLLTCVTAVMRSPVDVH